MILEPEVLNGVNLKAVWLSGFHFARDPTNMSKYDIGAVVAASDLGLFYPVEDNMTLVLNVLD